MMRKLCSRLIGWTLPQHLTPDIYRKTFILNILLVGSWLLSLLASVSAFISYTKHGNIYGGNSPLVPFIISLLFLGLLVLSKKSHGTLASLLLIVVYLLPTLFGIYLWTIYSIVSLLTLGLLIVLSGIVIGSRFMLVLTAGINLYIIGITMYHQTTHPHSIDWVRNVVIESSEGVIVAVLFCIISLVSYLSSREIEKLLLRTHASERELKKERDLLELRVKQRTEALQLSEAEKLSQLYRFAEIGKLTGGLFHDLVNPLTLVSYNIKELDRRSNGHVKTQELHELQLLISNAVEGTKRLEEFIMTVRKQLQNQSTVKQCILSEEISHIVDIFKHTLRKEHIILTLELQPHITLTVCPTRFSQILSNLVSNAIDAISLSKKKKRFIHISLTKEKNIIVITVTDNGTGISPQDLPFIYNPLFTTKKGNGTGIGLAIAKDIIEQDLHGIISVISSRNGTQFTIRFPLHKPHLPTKNL